MKQSAAEKQAVLWEAVLSTQGSTASWPNQALIFGEGMEESFSTSGDIMPEGLLWGTRTKYIHSVGTTGKVKFVSNGKHPY